MSGNLETKDWHPAEVKAQLEMRGTNLAKLARAHDYAHISEVLHRPWLAAEQIVAKALGIKPQQIWPTRYKLPRDRARLLTRNATVQKRHKATLSHPAKAKA
jgi:Ner family transcriptional regulator